VVVPLAAGPPAPELPPAEPLPLCASANVLDSASATAKPTLVGFMVIFFSADEGKPNSSRYVPLARRRKNREHCALDQSPLLPGGLSSPASQPSASVFIGSTGKEIFSVRWQVAHSNIRCSKPRAAPDIRPTPSCAAGRTHRPLYNGIAHITLPNERIGVPTLVVCSVCDSSRLKFWLEHNAV